MSDNSYFDENGVQHFNVSAHASAGASAGATEEPAPEIKEDKYPDLRAGFAILIDVNGNVYVERNLKIFSVPVEREATLIEIRRHISEILMDLQAQAAAEYVALRLGKGPTPPQE